MSDEEDREALEKHLAAVERALIKSGALLMNLRDHEIGEYWLALIDRNQAEINEAYKALASLRTALRLTMTPFEIEEKP